MYSVRLACASDNDQKGVFIVDDSKQKRKSIAGGILFLVLCLCVGAAGGGIAGYWFNRDKTTVVIQTAPPASNTSLDEKRTMAEQVAAMEGDSIVEVTTESKQTHPFFGSFIVSGAGSGVILSGNGYIVTNNHVIDNATTIRVRLHNGEELPAALVGTDQQTDLAVIKIDKTGLEPAVLADSADVTVGEPVVAIGNPLGTLGGTVTEGIISAKDREIIIGGESMKLLQTSAAINPGNSGGGLFDENGRLVGVVNAKSSGEEIEGIGFAIPADTVKTIAPALIEHGYVKGRPMLGVSLIDVDSMDKLLYYQLEQPGVYVAQAPASSALKQGDRILKVEGQDIVTADNIKTLIHKNKAGDSIIITVQRDGKEQDISVTLLESHPS